MSQLLQRLQALRIERERGAQQLAVLERERRDVTETLLRIDGAIQVLEELLGEDRAEVPLEAAAKV